MIGATIGCDRITKHLATSALSDAPGRSYLSGLVRLEYAENTGAFLGLGADLPESSRFLLFTVATGLMLLGLIVVTIRYRWAGWSLVGAAMFVAGGGSNWFDRLTHGHVVDFLIVGTGSVHTGIFNVADAAMMLGAGLVLLAELRGIRR